MSRVTMQVTVTFTYTTDPKHYPKESQVSPAKLAKFDKDSFENDLGQFAGVMEAAEDLKIKVEPL